MAFCGKARRSAATLGVLLTVAACKGNDALAPADLADPAALLAELAAADAAFDSDPFRSFSAVSISIGATQQTAAAQLAGPLAAATLPMPFEGTTRVLSAERAERLRQLAGRLAGPATHGLFPDPAYGNTFEWDEVDHRYEMTARTGAPADGVRFILYAVDEAGAIIEPVSEIGYADLLDLSTSSSRRLRVQIFGSGQASPYLDYTATISSSATSLAATVTGTITNLEPGTAERTLKFDVGLNASQTRATLTASFSLNSPAMTFQLTESVSVSQTALVITVDFRVMRAGETVRVVGRVEFTEVDGELVIEVSISVRVDDGIVARLTGDPETAVWQDAGGDPLHPSAYAALEALWDGLEAFQALVSSVLDPVANLTSN